MKTYSRKSLVYLAALSVVMLTASLAEADWYYDFEDRQVPDSLRILHNFFPGDPPPSHTFQATAAEQFLRLHDTRPPSQEGTRTVSISTDELFLFDHARVSTTINPAEESLALGPWVLLGPPIASGYGYSCHFWPYWPWADQGGFSVHKWWDRESVYFWASWEHGVPAVPVASSYFMELELVGENIGGQDATRISARLWDHEGGTTLFEHEIIDYGDLGGVPPITSGHAFISGFIPDDWGPDIAYNMTFDDIRGEGTPIPEPSTLVLAAMGATALLAVGSWRRKRKP